MSARDPPVGATVEIPAGRGVVRFAGSTAFAPGKWVGIELATASGKNNGIVNGTTYFKCKPNHGVFVRPSQVKVISMAPEPDSAAPQTPSRGAARPSLSHQRTTSTAGLTRTSSVSRTLSAASSATTRTPSPGKSASPTKAASPARTPSLSGTKSASPARPGHRPSPSLAVPSSATTTGRPAAAVNKRLSLSIQPRKSLPRNDSATTFSPTVASPLKTETPRMATRRSSMAPAPRRAPSPPPSAATPRIPSPLKEMSPPPPEAPDDLSPILSTTMIKPPSRSPSPLDPPEPQRNEAEVELLELRTKVRVLEAKRADDSRHVRELETRLSEAESFVALRPKLQAKLHEQQTELIATRRELSDAQNLAGLAEGRLVDLQEQLEMAMLDKEVAEERAEQAELELEETKERLAQTEVELKVIKEGGAEGGGGGDDDGGAEKQEEDKVKSSLAYIQLERQNERLKEALVRLRDISSENEYEYRRRITEMEKDVQTLDELQGQYEECLIKLQSAETQVEDLKLQLDDALGAEDLLVQLTERNLLYSEKIEEMRVTIEDLEALKELNDELEENHIETEKAMQEDLEERDLVIRDLIRKIETLEDACLDMEGTIGQFRELVVGLQTELDTLRAQTQTAREESATAVSQSAAMMSLNMKLQSSASKQQARNIELELLKLEGKEAKELLGIIQPYLPQLYVETDSDATSCYMFFQRLAAKADLINNVTGQIHNLPDTLNGDVTETLVGVCEMRGRLANFSTLCRRFAAILRRCDVESFLNIGRLYPELAPMEKRIDLHIELLRRDEFRVVECVSDILKLLAQFDHLADTYFSGYGHDLGERELGYALQFEFDLDMVAASMALAKTSVGSLLRDDDVAIDMGGLDAEDEFFGPVSKILDQFRAAKVVAKKLTKRVEDLIRELAALRPNLIPQLQALNNLFSELVNFGIQFAQQIMPHLNDVRGSKTAFELTTVVGHVRQVAASTVGRDIKEGVPAWDAVREYISKVVQEANALVPLTMENESVMKITGTAPWVIRVDDIKASLAVNVEAERKVAQLNDEMQGLYRSLKSKDQVIQEAGVKIELMERRMELVKKQADTISDLESELQKARKQERAYEEAMEQLQADLDALEQDNAKLKTMAVPQREASGAQQAEPENVPVEGNIETSYLLEQIDALRGTVRFLRTENSYLKGHDLLREIQSLPPLPETVSREPTPPLDPSGLSDTEDSDSELSSPPTLRSVATETKLLYRDVMRFSSSPRVVDLSTLNAKRGETKSGKVWMPKRKSPAQQVWERRQEAERLSRRVHGLLERANAIGAPR